MGVVQVLISRFEYVLRINMEMRENDRKSSKGGKVIINRPLVQELLDGPQKTQLRTIG